MRFQIKPEQLAIAGNCGRLAMDGRVLLNPALSIFLERLYLLFFLLCIEELELAERQFRFEDLFYFLRCGFGARPEPSLFLAD
jgi:hypothetical protein